MKRKETVDLKTFIIIEYMLSDREQGRENRKSGTAISRLVSAALLRSRNQG